jgi:hypothetical protein
MVGWLEWIRWDVEGSSPPVHATLFYFSKIIFNIVTCPGLDLMIECIGPLYNWLQQFTNPYLTHCHLLPTGHFTATILTSNWTPPLLRCTPLYSLNSELYYDWLCPLITPRHGPHGEHRLLLSKMRVYWWFPINVCPSVESVCFGSVFTGPLPSNGHMRQNIVTCTNMTSMSWLKTGFGLVIGFIEHLHTVITRNCSAVANSHTP